jgi:pyruvate/2-oxoglutarate/acetoin dehydrogenase E1 component
MKPVINMGFGDFALIAGDEIFHKLAKWRCMHGLDMPMTAVVIFPIGTMGGAGPEHSSCTEVLGMHFPGLKVVVPSNPADAKGLMKAALREPNPVIYHSVQSLGWVKASAARPSFIVPIGRAACLRPGTAATLLTYGSMVRRSLEAATRLQARASTSRSSIFAHWLRSIGARSSNRCAARIARWWLHEAVKTAGPGAEIAAQIQERAFFVEAPILRVAAKDVPVPQQAALEALCIPSVDDIVTAARQLVSM